MVKINDHNSHSFYKVSSLEEFAKMLDTEWAQEWDKANNCKDIVYKLELVQWLINRMTNPGKKISWTRRQILLQMQTPYGRCNRIERCLAFTCSCSTGWIRKIKEKTNATRSIVLAFVQDLNGYMIELIKRN